MGVQSNKVEKRKRRIRYIRRKKEAVKAKRKPAVAVVTPAAAPA